MEMIYTYYAFLTLFVLTAIVYMIYNGTRG